MLSYFRISRAEQSFMSTKPKMCSFVVSSGGSRWLEGTGLEMNMTMSSS